jgi:hypothetical protein
MHILLFQLFQLFFAKYRNHQNTHIAKFLEYFDAKWVKELPGWYGGYAPGVPVTNNALEATNNVIKNEQTFRERMPLSDFLDLMFNIVKTWSDERNQEDDPNHKQFFDQRNPSLKEWTEGYQWAKRGKTIQKEEGLYYANAGETVALPKTLVAQYRAKMEALNWRKLESMHDTILSMHEIKIEKDCNSSSCSCSWNAKYNLCKHTIGMALILRLVKAPPEAKTVPIGQKRKRGRPSKAKPALEYQDLPTQAKKNNALHKINMT